MLSQLVPETVPEWQAWCRDYERETPYPVGGPHIRFSVGLYQIYQAIAWLDSQAGTGLDSKAHHESLASAATHFLMAAEAWKAPTEQYLDPGVLTAPYASLDYKDLLYHISAAQQMFFYGYVAKVNDAVRSRSRFKLDGMAQHVAAAVTSLVRAIPVADRAEAFTDATKIMTGRI